MTKKQIEKANSPILRWVSILKLLDAAVLMLSDLEETLAERIGDKDWEKVKDELDTDTPPTQDEAVFSYTSDVSSMIITVIAGIKDRIRLLNQEADK